MNSQSQITLKETKCGACCLLPLPSILLWPDTRGLITFFKGSNLNHLRMSQVWMDSPQAGLAAGLAPL